ncbi:MAG: peptidoglycan-binding protein, partial [Solobacterium sp.]|nr:peptidoglycan-binding protein [Solobacterium sp.]
ITITRAAVSATAFGEILSDNTGYLQIYQFGENTTNEVKTYLDDFKNANVSNIVIDLRDNGGGYLTALQGIASYFLPKDTLAMKQVYADGTTEEIRTTDGMYDNIKKIAILVNKNTASASEVLTMALKEQHPDVTVIGVTTYGKGTVQVSRVFKDGSALKYTTSKWTSPNDVWVNGVGITPDDEVKLHEVMYTSLPKMNDTDRYAYDSVGEPVKFAQLCLDYLGYNVGRTDGYFSSQTEEALRQFETDKGIAADGVLDKETFSTLYSAVVLDWNTTKTHDIQLQKAQEVLNG